MDAFFLPLLAVMLAEIGDKTMLLAMLLGARFRRPAPVLAGIAVAAAANAAIAATGGAILAATISHRAMTLMLALALIGAGIGSVSRNKRPDAVEGWRLGAFATTAIAFFILGFGDKAQFLTFAFAAQGGAPALAGVAAAIGVLIASVPAVLIGTDIEALPLRRIRLAAGVVLILAGLWTAPGALLLI